MSNNFIFNLKEKKKKNRKLTFFFIILFSSTWSSVGRSNSDTGWPDSATNDITSDSKDTQWNSSQAPANAFADIIPEFEPGKPWKVV